MSRNGSGVYSLPAGNPVVTGTTISSSWANTTLSDIATALTGSVAADGQTAMTGNLQMGNNKITGLAVATASGDALSYGQAATISALTVSGLTSGRVVYTSTGGLLASSANLLYSGTDLTVYGLRVGRGAGAVSTNTALGASALNSNTSGVSNTAIGYVPLFSNTTGNSNIAIGQGSMYNNTTGGNNVAVGVATLEDSTTGSNNTAIGLQALKSNTTASGNTAVGYQSLYTNTATQNTAVGYQSLYSNAGAVRNTAIGYGALDTNSTGEYNTAVGAFAGDANTTGSANVIVGYDTLSRNTTGANNTALGTGALVFNTTASYNTSVGYQAGYNVTTGEYSVFIGSRAGSSGATRITGPANTMVGDAAGFALQGAAQTNTFIGQNSGSDVTTGNSHTIIGRYTGNGGGYDIRTASNFIVLSDGGGNPRVTVNASGRVDFNTGIAQNTTTTSFVIWNTTGADVIYEASNNSPTAISGAMRISKNGSNNRSINAAGTVNQNGADYAEYMTKAGDFTIVKGDVVGIDTNGKLTNVFADAISFCVKSTDPGLVGGDSWFTEQRPKNERGDELSLDTNEYQAWFDRMEEARAKVDRIAFCGQVPVNVTGATAGQYIVPVNDNGTIKGEAVSNPTFEQYQISVGKVIAIEADGRAKIIVKVA
jgi:hypothetical protein